MPTQRPEYHESSIRNILDGQLWKLGWRPLFEGISGTPWANVSIGSHRRGRFAQLAPQVPSKSQLRACFSSGPGSPSLTGASVEHSCSQRSPYHWFTSSSAHRAFRGARTARWIGRSASMTRYKTIAGPSSGGLESRPKKKIASEPLPLTGPRSMMTTRSCP